MIAPNVHSVVRNEAFCKTDLSDILASIRFWAKEGGGPTELCLRAAPCLSQPQALHPGGQTLGNQGVLGTQQPHHAGEASTWTAPGEHTWLLHPAVSPDSLLPYKCFNAQQGLPFAFADAPAVSSFQLSLAQLLWYYLYCPCRKIFFIDWTSH